jgi:hypothetical protein
MKSPRKIEPKAEVRGPSGNGGTGGFKQIGPGRYERIVSEGGEVVSPFVPGKIKEGAEEGKEIQTDLLNDNLPLTLDPSQEDSSTSGIGSVEFLKKSPKLGGSSTGPNSSKNSTKNILSLPSPNSNSSQKTNRKKLSNVSSVQQGTVIFPLKKQTDLRQIPKRGDGRWYITDMKTGVEYSEEEFEKNTGAVCSCCKSPIGSMTEVFEFLSKKHFICTTCVEDVPEQKSFIKAR